MSAYVDVNILEIYNCFVIITTAMTAHMDGHGRGPGVRGVRTEFRSSARDTVVRTL